MFKKGKNSRTKLIAIILTILMIFSVFSVFLNINEVEATSNRYVYDGRFISRI